MAAETLEFKAELKQLLHLITHSLYSDREIFLRELISNASDAINKVRFDSLANADKLEGNNDWKIKIIADKDGGTLTISDNGIGMIARGGDRPPRHRRASPARKAFLEAAKQAGKTAETPGPHRPVRRRLLLRVHGRRQSHGRHPRRPASPPTASKWESDGQGAFTVEPCEKPTRGTDVILHLKDDAKEFLDPWQLAVARQEVLRLHRAPRRQPAAPPSTCSPTRPAPPSRSSTWASPRLDPRLPARRAAPRPRSVAGTGDLAVEPAMTVAEARPPSTSAPRWPPTSSAAAPAASSPGDMGIGNTTPSAAVIAALTGRRRRR